MTITWAIVATVVIAATVVIVATVVIAVVDRFATRGTMAGRATADAAGRHAVTAIVPPGRLTSISRSAVGMPAEHPVRPRRSTVAGPHRLAAVPHPPRSRPIRAAQATQDIPAIGACPPIGMSLRFKDPYCYWLRARPGGEIAYLMMLATRNQKNPDGVIIPPGFVAFRFGSPFIVSRV